MGQISIYANLKLPISHYIRYRSQNVTIMRIGETISSQSCKYVLYSLFHNICSGHFFFIFKVFYSILYQFQIRFSSFKTSESGSDMNTPSTSANRSEMKSLKKGK